MTASPMPIPIASRCAVDILLTSPTTGNRTGFELTAPARNPAPQELQASRAIDTAAPQRGQGQVGPGVGTVAAAAGAARGSGAVSASTAAADGAATAGPG